MKNWHILLIIGALLNPLQASDALLEEALNEANSGNSAQAIEKLEKLKGQHSGDSRIHQSLGLLYQSQDQQDKAISELETAVSLSPTPEAYYALGLLYEAKMLTDSSSKSNAIHAWESYLQTASSSDSNRTTAERHLKRLRN